MEKSSSKSVREKLNQWDTKLAVLDEFQREGIIDISSVANQRPFPLGVRCCLCEWVNGWVWVAAGLVHSVLLVALFFTKHNSQPDMYPNASLFTFYIFLPVIPVDTIVIIIIISLYIHCLVAPIYEH